MIEPFLSTVPILNKLEEAGFEAYFVGGSVRDFLLGKAIHDVDIATSATPEEVKRIFPKTVDIGIQHGTVLVLYKNDSYEITTFRTESEYIDYRRPKEVAFVRSLEKDLERRDFTMNAIAMDRQGAVIDPYHGQQAITDRRIETVGKAKERFQEDALRIMRALRFVSQLSFRIETRTLKAVIESAHLLEKIAIERKRAEFEKLLTGPAWRTALQLLLDTKLFRYLPVLSEKEESISKLLHYECERLNLNELWALFVFFASLSENEADTFLRAWKLPVKQIRKVQSILFFLSIRLKQNWSVSDLYRARMETILSVEKIYQILKGEQDDESINRVLALYQHLPIKERSELAVTGGDVMQWYDQPGGPWVSDLIAKIEESVLLGEVSNDQQTIKEWLLKCNQN